MIKKKIFYYLTFLIFFTLLGQAKAQMFSVSSERPLDLLPRNSLYIGLESASFQFRGSDSPYNISNFNDAIYRLKAELPGFTFFLGYSNRIGDADSLSFLNAGVAITGRYGLLGRRALSFGVPLMLRTDFTQVALRLNDPEWEDFRQNSALIGLGFDTQYRINERIRIHVDAIPQYGFSVTSFGGTGGSILVLEGRARLYFDNLFDNFGLSLGYDWRFTRFDLQDERFNYDLGGHSFLVGITF